MESLRKIRDAAVRAAREELPEPVAFDTVQAAVYVGLTRKQLEHLRVRGGGPRFAKLGRHVRYLRSDLDAWLHSHRVANTSKGVQS